MGGISMFVLHLQRFHGFILTFHLNVLIFTLCKNICRDLEKSLFLISQSSYPLIRVIILLKGEDLH